LPQAIFDALIKTVPFVACEIVLTGPNGVLLTWRKDKLWTGWHFPGGLLRFRERFEERLEQVAWNELGITLTGSKFLFAEDCSHGIRGHIISLVFLCTTAAAPKKGKFFKKMPKNIIDAHKEMWVNVKQYIK